MFFMGGMTLGYLHPPAPVKVVVGATTAAAEEKSLRGTGSPPSSGYDGAVERTLLWARRILC